MSHFDLYDIDLSEVKLFDLEDIFQQIFSDQLKANTLYKKILFFNSKQEDDRKWIINLEDLLALNPQEFINTKGMGNSGVLLKKFTDQFSRLKEPEIKRIIEAVHINLEDFEEQYLGIKLMEMDEDFIPSLIRKKLSEENIKTIGDVFTHKNHFKNKPGNHSAFQILVQFLINNQEQVKRDYRYRLNGKPLLEEIAEENSGQLLDWFAKILLGYLELLTERDRLFIKRFWGLVGKKSFSMDQLADLYDLTRERVRQLIHYHTEVLQKIITRKPLDEKELRKKFNYLPIIQESLSDQYISLFDEIGQHHIISRQNILSILKEDFDTKVNKDNEKYFELFLQITRLERVRYYHKQESPGTSRFSSETYYLRDPDKKDFQTLLRVSNVIYDVLQETVIPMPEFDLIVDVVSRTNLTIKSRDFILSIVENVPEFEILTNKEIGESHDEDLFQLRFDKLSSWSARVERVLFEVGSEQHLNELVKIIEDKYRELGIIKTIKPTSIQNGTRHNPNIISHGKRNIYSLRDWGMDANSIETSIINVFLKENKPLKPSEISKHVLIENDTLNPKSIFSIISILNWDKLFQLENKKYILAEWAPRYRKQLLKKPEKTEAEKLGITKVQEAYNILKNYDSKPILQSEFRKILTNSHGFRPGTIDSIINNEKYFVRINDENNRIRLDIKPDVSLENDKKSLIEILTEKAIEFLEKKPNQKSTLNEIADWLHKNFIPHHAKTNTYKVFLQENLFEKSVDIKGNSYISLAPNVSRDIEAIHNVVSPPKGYQYDWVPIKRQLTIELEELINAPNQPILNSGTSFADLLELYYSFLKYQTGKTVLDQLANDVLLSVEKYFLAQRDLHDAKAYHKVILLALEACMLKIIFIVDQSKFQHFDNMISQGKIGPGLGAYLKVLNRIDPQTFRYKDHNTNPIPDSNFLKHINRAYQARNKIAHLGGDYNANTEWNSTSINQNIKSGLIVALYAVFQYRKEIAAII